jgi:two-component system, cell cycle response regulator DivK
LAAKLRLQGKRVLIVDDHHEDRVLLGRMIALYGAEVSEAEDGRAALRIAATAPPDLLLCDLRMPTLDGFELIERLRQDPRLARIATIAVSALGSQDDLNKTWLAGFDGHLVKPILPEVLETHLRRVFSANEGGDGSNG